MVQTWFTVLKLLLLVVIHHDVRLHGDQLLLVELSEVEQGQLVKLLVAEQHLHGGTKLSGCSARQKPLLSVFTSMSFFFMASKYGECSAKCRLGAHR